MKSSRRLTLKCEQLTELGPDALRTVAGGTHIGCDVTHGTLCETCIFTVPPTQCQITQTCTAP